MQRQSSRHERQFATQSDRSCATHAQFVRRMGFQSAKPLVMFRARGDMEVLKQYPGTGAAQRICPATVCDKLNVGYMVKYWLQTDDGSVRDFYLLDCCSLPCLCSLPSQADSPQALVLTGKLYLGLSAEMGHCSAALPALPVASACGRYWPALRVLLALGRR